LGTRPAPDTPDAASTMMPVGSTSPARMAVASRRRDELGALQRGPEQLGQAEGEVGQQLGGAVLVVVPGRVEPGVLQAEVGREVDDVLHPAPQLGHDGLRRAMGQPEEHEVEPIGHTRLVAVEPLVAIAPGERWVQVGDGVAGLAVAGRELDLEVGVLGAQPE
jgi:hypothetical protein